MSETGNDPKTGALEDIAYLSRSPNRVVILETLTDGSFSRGELTDRTEVSRTTLDRIVNELEERGWAERTTEGAYTATAQGTHLMRRFRPFLESVEALNELDEAIDWLPIDELSIGLEHFDDAEVRRPAAEDPVEAIDFMTDLLSDAAEFRVLTHFVPPEPFEETMHDRVAAQQLGVDGVTTDEVIEYIGTRPRRADRWTSLLDAGAEVSRMDEQIPCNIWIFDETVLIKKSGPERIDESYGVPIVSGDPTVRSWAHGLIDQWMQTATPVDADAFGGPESEPALE